MTDSGDESDFASAESDPEEQDERVVEGRTGAGGQESRSEKSNKKEEGEREGGGGNEGEGEGRGGGEERNSSVKGTHTVTRDPKPPENKDSPTLEEKERTQVDEVTSVRADELRGHRGEQTSGTGPITSLEKDRSTVAKSQEAKEAAEGRITGKEVEVEDRELQQGKVTPPVGVGEGGGGEGGGRGGGGEGGRGGGGEGGGWGWGGWGRSLWSSVSTVTESAQVLGQKVTAAITTVEDALGLPSPHELATDKEGEGEGGRGGEKEGGGTEESREDKKEVDTLAKLAEKIVEHDVEPQAPKPTDSSSNPVGHKVEPEPDREEEESAISAFSGFFSGIASAVEQKSMQLMSEGLGALENIGKKTMEVLTEGDPGLQNKRKLLKGDAPSLSLLLREAKAEAEARQNEAKVSGEEGQTPLSYSGLFDEYHGVVHLEALELLSKEYAAKVHGCLPALAGEEGERAQQQMELVAHALAITENKEGLDVLDDDSGKLGEIMELFADITLPLKVEKLIKVSDFWREKLDSMSASLTTRQSEETSPGETRGKWEGGKRREGGGGREKEGGERGQKELKRDEAEGVEVKERQGEGEGAEDEKREKGQKTSDNEKRTESEEKSEELETKEKDGNLTCEVVYGNGLRGLVELTSVSIELFRKMAEISLLPQTTRPDPIEQAEKFNRLTVLVSNELDALASVHAEVLTDLATKDVNSTITSLYLESSNSVSYVQDALQLLKPVLQYIVVQEVTLLEPGPNVHTRS